MGWHRSIFKNFSDWSSFRNSSQPYWHSTQQHWGYTPSSVLPFLRPLADSCCCTGGSSFHRFALFTGSLGGHWSHPLPFLCSCPLRCCPTVTSMVQVFNCQMLYFQLDYDNPNEMLCLFHRYSFFLALYPMGVTGELLCCFAALPLYNATQKYSVNLPNKLNFTFSFYYFIVVFMLFYFPGKPIFSCYLWTNNNVKEIFFLVFPKLFGHMLAQRRKVLGGGTKQD